jgi:DNA (cytosine-5)-methyltransferase 3A
MIPTDGSYVKRPPSQPNEILYEEPYVKLNGNRAGCVGYVGNSPKQSTRIYSVDGKSQCLSANGGGQGGKTGLYQVPICGRIVGRKINPETGKRDDYNPDLKMEQRIEPRLDEKSGTLTTVQKDNVLIQESLVFLNENQQRKIDKINPTLDKANCLTTAIGRGGSSSEYLTSVKKKTLLLDEQGEGPTYRKLTVKECSRLQTLPDSYLEDCFDEKGKKISNSQKYRALGNGWTVDVIVHILQGMKYIVKD